MRKRLARLVSNSATIAATAFYHPEAALAMPEKHKSALLAKGRISEIDIRNDASHSLETKRNKHLWLLLQEREGTFEVYVQSNVWAPGGSTGWHSHPGRSLIIVTAGTVTDYEGHDPECTPHVYKAGMAFVDPGGDHVHILRNEGTLEARTIAIQLIPENAACRIDVVDPGNCHF